MIVAALRHFCVVGLAFTLALGWLATNLVNRPLGSALSWLLGRPLNDYYSGALLLTVVSLTLIIIATVIGNRVFRRNLPWRLTPGALTLSTLCYLGLVGAIVIPESAEIVNPWLYHLSYAYNHPEFVNERLWMLSLPALRAIVLPSSYLIAGLSCVQRTEA